MILNEGIKVQNVHYCLLCENEGTPLYQNLRDRLFGAPGTWNFFRCPQCGLVWLNPRPIIEDIGKVYINYYTHVSGKPNSPKPWLASLQKKVKQILLVTAFGYNNLPISRSAQWFGRILNLISPLMELVGLTIMNLPATEKGKLLDVGCGSGRFLAWMRDLGWEVMGVEPDPEAVEVAQKQFGIDVYQGILEEAGFPAESFDVITMRHVLEHLTNPITTLKECQRVLKRGGKIVVLTPNIDSLLHQLVGKAWSPLDPPRHLNLFSPHTLCICAERAGFWVSHLRTPARNASWVWVDSRFIHRKGMLSGNFSTKVSWQWRLEGLMILVLEQMLCFVKEAGEEIFMIAIKEGML